MKAKKNMPEGFRKIDGRIYFREIQDSNKRNLDKIAEKRKKKGKKIRIIWSKKHLKYGLYVHDTRIKIN